MGAKLAFYAPLKSPNHQVPSGDRTVARGVVAALRSIEWVDQVDLVSELRSRDGSGDVALQKTLVSKATEEVERLLAARPPIDAWVTYHNYYKAPDLIGPAVCKALNIPYFLIEASRSPKRAVGPWALFAELSEQASDAARAIFYFTNRDLPELEVARPKGQLLVHLPPFLDLDDLPAAAIAQNGKRLLAVGMLRSGDKLASFKMLADALEHVVEENWTLGIVGDGEARSEIERLFSRFQSRVSFLGQLPKDQVLEEMRAADVLVWPGVNEAFGMVYIEAQSVGLPVIAEDRPGVRDVVGPKSWLVTAGDRVSFAQAIDTGLSAPWDTEWSRAFVRKSHLKPAAMEILAETIGAELGVEI